MSVCWLVGWFVCPSVRPSVGNAFVKIDEKWPFTDSKQFRCWTREREEEEGGTKRKEGQREKSDEESEKMKNEKVAKGRIVGLAGPCFQGFKKQDRGSQRCILEPLIHFFFYNFTFRYVGWSIGPSVTLLSKSMKNNILRILNDLDSAGRGGKRDKEGDKEEGATRRVKT